MNNFPYFDILILAMIAVFIINRLRNVLGKKTGNESDIVEKFTQKKATFKESDPDEVSNTTVKNDKENQKNIKFHSNKSINNAIKEILKIDPNFEIESFHNGARKAFEYILTQYSKNDIKSLEKLISKKINKAFEDQIKLREKNSETLEITVISVKDPVLKDVSVQKKSVAFVKLSFDSEQVQITKNQDGSIVDGDSNQILSIKEDWTFSKDLKNDDPNWILEEIEESN